MAVKLLTEDWKPGRIVTYGTRHEISSGAVRIVYELGRNTYSFRGVERVVADPAGEFAGDRPALVEHQGSGAVAKATWVHLYKADKQRRSYY